MWLQAFLLLLALGTVGAAAAVTLIAALRNKWSVARNAGIAAALVATGYVVLLMGAGITAGETTLARGAEKHICELDCHFAYKVVDVKRQGSRARVTLQVAFDRGTISARRDTAIPSVPGGRVVRLRDAGGREYKPVAAGDLRRPLRPGERYTTELVFDVDPSAAGLVLYISDADLSKKVLIGSDNGLLRTPVGLQLES